MNLRQIIIIKGITSEYAHRLSLDLFNELRRRVEERTFSIVSSEDFIITYQNLKPSLVERHPDNDYAYIIDTLNDIKNYYMIVPEE